MVVFGVLLWCWSIIFCIVVIVVLVVWLCWYGGGNCF